MFILDTGKTMWYEAHAAIAIDDEPVALSVIRSHAGKVPFLEMKGYFTNAFEAMEHLSRERTDLLFLDIKMPDITGIDFLTEFV